MVMNPRQGEQNVNHNIYYSTRSLDLLQVGREY